MTPGSGKRLFELRAAGLLPLLACLGAACGPSEPGGALADLAQPEAAVADAAETYGEPTESGEPPRSGPTSFGPAVAPPGFGQLPRPALASAPEVDEASGGPGSELVQAVDLDPGQASWVETRYRGSDKPKTRRQVVRVDEGIENHGPYTRWYENGVVAEQGAFEHGRRTGRWIERFETGQPKSEIDYLAGELHGLKREYSDVGYVKKETEFEHGLRHGSYTTWTMLYEDQRTVRISGSHEHGLKVGDWLQNYGDGSPRERGRYEADLKVGEWTSWHPNGRLKEVAEHQAGQWHGRVTTYDESGDPVAEGTYEHGVPAGLHVDYHPGGIPREETTYAGGRPNGPSRSFHQGGEPASEGLLVDGLKEGPWTFWTPSGEVDSRWTGVYRAGARVEQADDGAPVGAGAEGGSGG